jgi:DNA-binding HxlR family transcriptional regulator
MGSATHRSARNDDPCSIARSLEVLGERWTLLILREALGGKTRFSEFREALGIAPDVLADRLATLTESGVLDRRPYQEQGSRARHSYHLTPAGAELRLVLGALQQWGDVHRPGPDGPTIERRSAGDDRPVRVAFVDDADRPLDLDEVVFVPTWAHPSRRGHERSPGSSATT